MNRILVTLLCLIYIFFMADLMIFYYAKDQTEKSLVALGGVVGGVAPLLLTFFTKLQFKLALIVLYFIFLYGSQYLGPILGWYEKIEWWDTLLHGMSGVLLAFIGIALYKHVVDKKTVVETFPWFVFLFVLSFAVLGGTLWEIGEFSADHLFGTTFQNGSLKDTMTDLIADTIGGMVIAIWYGLLTNIKS
jgi:hypothetical protein